MYRVWVVINEKKYWIKSADFFKLVEHKMKILMI